MLVRIVNDYKDTIRTNYSFEFKSYKIFGENLAAFTSNPTKTYWDERTLIQLLYSNTERLIYEIKCEDLYSKVSEKKKHFE